MAVRSSSRRRTFLEAEPVLQPAETVDATSDRPVLGVDLLSTPVAIGGLLLTLTAVSLSLRAGGLTTGLWMDAGISVGIASHPRSQIPGLLRADGSPPLDSALLPAWMALFGS